MENCGKIKTEYDQRSQLLLNVNRSFETSDVEVSSSKNRKKLCEQDMFWIDTTGEAPKYMNFESGKKFSTNEQNSRTSSNETNLCEIKTEFKGPIISDTESTFQIPQGYAGRPTNISYDKQFFDFSKEKFYFGRKKRQFFTLYPPPNGIIPKVEQSPGCKTVIISGFPHILKHGTVKSMFNHCGIVQKMTTVDEGVFHIAYACQTGVDNVIRLNGHEVVGVYKGIHFTGTITVEFAPIWLKKHGFTCEKILNLRYSRNGIAKLIQDLEQGSMIEQCVNVFIFWLQGGKCTKSNYLHFFLVLKAMHALVSRCISEANKFDEFVRQDYCNQILKAFTLACSETVLDNLNQFKDQVVKWKKFIEEINVCKSWEAIAALKKVKLELKNSVHQESITSNSLSEILYSKTTKKTFKSLIEGLEQDYVHKTGLKKAISWMKRGKCTKVTEYKYYIALKAMYGFITRFISDPIKFDELVRQGYCGRISEAFRVACSEAVIKNFKCSVKNKIKKWKKFIEEVNKCKSWEEISAFANGEKKQEMVQSESLLPKREPPNMDLKAAETMIYNQNSSIQYHKTANHNNENKINHNEARYFNSEKLLKSDLSWDFDLANPT